MSNITHLFDMFARVAFVIVILCIIFTVIYFRWRAAGQERGI